MVWRGRVCAGMCLRFSCDGQPPVAMAIYCSCLDPDRLPSPFAAGAKRHADRACEAETAPLGRVREVAWKKPDLRGWRGRLAIWRTSFWPSRVPLPPRHTKYSATAGQAPWTPRPVRVGLPTAACKVRALESRLFAMFHPITPANWIIRLRVLLEMRNRLARELIHEFFAWVHRRSCWRTWRLSPYYLAPPQQKINEKKYFCQDNLIGAMVRIRRVL